MASDAVHQDGGSAFLPIAGFARQVKDALKHLYDPVALHRHPLTQYLVRERDQSTNRGAAGTELRDGMLAALSRLATEHDPRDSSSMSRRSQLLHLRFVEALDPTHVQRQLGLSRAQYYREQGAAVGALALVLARQWGLVAGGPAAGAPQHDEARRRDRTALPHPLTSFIGREREIAAVTRLIAAHRLVVLVGAGGSGKTRLAIEVARAVQHTFASGIRFVSLGSLSSPALVPAALAEALGEEARDGRSVADEMAALTGLLYGEHILLVLDNFEHLLAAAPRVAEVLQACPRVSILVTSRAPLRLSGEYDLRVPALSLPTWPPASRSVAGSGVPGTDVPIPNAEAVKLFVERAQAVDPTFALTEANATAVAELCCDLDGLPLAIELAAARLGTLPLSTVRSLLKGRLDLLAGGPPDVPPRQQTLWNTIGWSYDLLSPPAQRLLRHLAVFAGDCTPEAAAAVSGAAGPSDTVFLESAAALVEQSLLQRVDLPDGAARCHLPATIRSFARAQLESHGEVDMARRRHASYLLRLVERLAGDLSGPNLEAALDGLEGEHDNLRATLGWALACSEAAYVQRLGAALERFWSIRGHCREGLTWLVAALDLPVPAAPGVRAAALVAASVLARAVNDYAQARVFAEESVALAQADGTPRLLADALDSLGLSLRAQGAFARASALHREALALRRRVEDARGLASTTLCLALVARDQGQYRRAAALLEASLAVQRAHGDRHGAAITLHHLAVIASARGDHRRAGEFREQSLLLQQQLGNRRGLAVTYSAASVEAGARGQAQCAAALCTQALLACREVGERWSSAQCLAVLARLVQAQGRPAEAATLLAAATTLREGSARPESAEERALRDDLCAALGQGVFQTAWAGGRALSFDQAITLGLDAATELEQVPACAVAPPARRRPGPHRAIALGRPLTARERQVAVLVMQGCTNHQIGEALVISERTASNHVANILLKLGARKRAQIAAWAAEHGLASLLATTATDPRGEPLDVARDVPPGSARGRAALHDVA